MYENAVPVFEMKNKLSFFLHKAESEGPVFISSRGRPEFVLQTIEDYEKLTNTAPKEKSLFERIQESRKEYGLEDDDFDFSEHLEKLRKEELLVSEREERYLKELLDEKSDLPS